MDLKKKEISKESVVFEVPPNYGELVKLSLEEIQEKTLKAGLSLSQIENIKDEDKRKIFLVNEILRIDPPFPKSTPPVLVNTEYFPQSMEKMVRYKYVKHIIIEAQYSHSLVTEEEYKTPILQSELDIMNKNDLDNSIMEEINNLDINDYNSKTAIMGFACNNAKTSGEKRKRMVMLQKHLRNELGDDYKHRRITNHEISIY